MHGGVLADSLRDISTTEMHRHTDTLTTLLRHALHTVSILYTSRCVRVCIDGRAYGDDNFGHASRRGAVGELFHRGHAEGSLPRKPRCWHHLARSTVQGYVIVSASVSVNSRFIQRIIATPLMRCVRQ